ncbi:meiosis regulator and mRNA stability factor 1 isoform 3-T4 [Synchiropus picturatus]
MDGVGKERPVCSSKPFQWTKPPKTEASALLWKLKDCFSTNEKAHDQLDSKTKIMENRTVLQLKDVPPPHHMPTSRSSQLFPNAPLPSLPPALLPPQLTQDCHSQQPPQSQQASEGVSPKVRMCSHCDFCSPGHGLLVGERVVGSTGCSSMKNVSLHRPSNSVQAMSNSTSVNTSGSSGSCSGAPALQHFRHTLNCEDEAPDKLQTDFKPQMLSAVATSQPLSSHPYPLCCSGLLHNHSSLCLPHSQPTLHFPDPSVASSLPSVSSLPIPMHDPFMASPRYCTCGVNCTPLARNITSFGDHPATTTITSSTSAHFCSDPVRLNVERTICVKGAHFCQMCLLKPVNGVAAESEKSWPNVPVPHLAPISIPICNGCGTSSEGLVRMPMTNIGKTGPTYGSLESGGTENIPPVGVFWDIENCSVPTGRSAGAVVERIRERFFQGHREAEFICVCDISKESKAVIQELNNCQVTVAHIHATSKNAADDKLRQSLRRFAETHTAPATVVLVSSDVNFASELSDLRHRHGFHVILVHGSQTSQALMQHANQHVAFQEITADLPPRMPTNTQELGNLENKTSLNINHLDKAASSSSLCTDDSRAFEHLPHPSPTGVSAGRQRDDSNPPSAPESDFGDRTSEEFKISTPSAFSKLNLHRSFSPLVLSQSSWSSRSASPCLSSRSSPLLSAPRSPCPEGRQEPFSDGAEILVANLDYRLSRKDLQQTLLNIFSRFGRVKAVELSPHTDYQLKATVQMFSLQQAISAVSGLHRYKIGGRRIQVSLVTGGRNKALSLLSSEIVSILLEAPANCLPLLKFTEIYKKKYARRLVIGDLYELPEVVAVREQGGSRLVCLLPSSQVRQSPLGSSHSQEGSSSTSCSPVVFEELEYHEPVCRQHYTQQNFSEADFDPDSYQIPFVMLSLNTLAAEVHSLLQSHEGTLPLLSFPDCYEAQFRPLELVNETIEGAVPLEHLITCVPSITIVTAQNGFKVIKWIHNKPPTVNSAEPWIQRCKSPVGNPQLIQFSREIIDLLKSQPSCLMPMNKFIPSYHHHFAKQCRVSDYGFSKLLELLEAVPHVLQILGMGSKRMLTLTHRAQVKRFTQDLLKLLKFQASKQVALKDFMQAYHWCFSRDWRVADYGTCDLMDLLTEIPDTTITVARQEQDTVISVPKRERTAEEIERTKKFGKEVVDLLRHQPHCRMPFSKFIPTYHHHFCRQCKLSYYGFTKLMELFEAIPEVLTVLQCGEEKVLTLTEVEQIKALAAQLVKLLRAQKTSTLPVNQLLTEYSKTFGYGLRLQDYDVSSLPALLNKLCHVVKVVDSPEGREVQLINRKSLRLLTTQLLALLMSQEENVDKGLTVEELSQRYLTVYRVLLNPCEYGFLSLSELLKSLPYLVEVYNDSDESIKAGNDAALHGDEWVRLTMLYQFARNVRALLNTYHYNQIFLTEFHAAYSKFTGCGLEPRSYGYNGIDELLGAISQVVWIKGHGHKRIIVLKNDMKAKTGSPVPSSPQPGASTETPRDSPVSSDGCETPRQSVAGSAESELLCLTSSEDLLCGPVPSCLPSPQLHPDPVLLRDADLIRFEDKTSATAGGHKPGSSSSDTAANTKTPLSVESPSRRGARSRIKLAANFSFSAGL